MRSWSDYEGSRHFVVRDLAGACLHAGWTALEIHQHIGAILHCVDDPEIRDRKKAVDDTLTKAAAEEAVTGFNSLAEYLDGDVANALKTLWGLAGDALSVLTIGGTPLTAKIYIHLISPYLFDFLNITGNDNRRQRELA